MKYFLIGLFCTFILFITNLNQVAHARVWYEEEQKQDVTGDKIKETILIKGKINSEEKTELQDVYLQLINGANGKTIKIPLDDGIKPNMRFVDFNHDGVKDVMITLRSTLESSKLNSYIYSFKNHQKVNLQVPLPMDVMSQFQDQYQAELKVQNKTYRMDVTSRKNIYEKLGLYHNGKLNEPMELIVSPYVSLKSTYTIKGYGLMGVQRVSGAFKEDVLGEITTVWINQSGKWQLYKSSFKNVLKKS
ncbi:hypothetical protein [Bacillus massiliigorillae]|uniref:hypothetical protein n=1 Tax=Bacillus massiliigorillae TaxID=1243664 RepID=UPI0003A24B8D|nr:hypothetical protein [Bacillus massiliigorillae]